MQQKAAEHQDVLELTESDALATIDTATAPRQICDTFKASLQSPPTRSPLEFSTQLLP